MTLVVSGARNRLLYVELMQWSGQLPFSFRQSGSLSRFSAAAGAKDGVFTRIAYALFCNMAPQKYPFQRRSQNPHLG